MEGEEGDQHANALLWMMRSVSPDEGARISDQGSAAAAAEVRALLQWQQNRQQQQQRQQQQHEEAEEEIVVAVEVQGEDEKQKERGYWQQDCQYPQARSPLQLQRLDPAPCVVEPLGMAAQKSPMINTCCQTVATRAPQSYQPLARGSE